jgi:K+-sensing histidine kinase KdpD
VAHDLRTPLQAFQSEMELLHDNIAKMEPSSDQPHSLLKHSLLKSIKQLKRICNFMNMTINRSIDFTKASSGIKLNPAIESVNFSETLKWAVGCMVQSHSSVPLVILPIPTFMHNQIYTDKQVIERTLNSYMHRLNLIHTHTLSYSCDISP